MKKFLPHLLRQVDKGMKGLKIHVGCFTPGRASEIESQRLNQRFHVGGCVSQISPFC